MKKFKDGVNTFTNNGTIDGLIENTTAEEMFEKAWDSQEICLYTTKDKKYLAVLQVEAFYMADTEGWDSDEEDGFEVSFAIVKASEKLDLNNLEAVDKTLYYNSKGVVTESEAINNINEILERFKTFRIMVDDSKKPQKKFNVGDSVKFKDGRTGIVEDYDEKYFYIKDSNANSVKIKKNNRITDRDINKMVSEKLSKDNEFKNFPDNVIENILNRGDKMEFLYNRINSRINELQRLYEKELISNNPKESYLKVLKTELELAENTNMEKLKKDYEEIEKVLGSFPASFWNENKPDGGKPYPIYTEADLEEEDPNYFNYGIRNAYEF